MNLHTGLKIKVQVKFCDFVEANQDVYISQTRTKSIFSVSFQISVEEDVSSGDCPLGRMLSELSTSIPGRKNLFKDIEDMI